MFEDEYVWGKLYEGLILVCFKVLKFKDLFFWV